MSSNLPEGFVLEDEPKKKKRRDIPEGYKVAPPEGMVPVEVRPPEAYPRPIAPEDVGPMTEEGRNILYLDTDVRADERNEAMGYGTNLLGQYLRGGLGFGSYLDEAEQMMLRAMRGEKGDPELNRYVADRAQQQFSEENPIASGVANVAGGVHSLAAIPGLPQAAATQPLWKVGGAALAGGGVEGLIYGRGEGEGGVRDPSRVEAGKRDAAIGAVTGPVGVGAARGGARVGGALYEKGAEWLRDRYLKGVVRRAPEVGEEVGIEEGGRLYNEGEELGRLAGGLASKEGGADTLRKTAREQMKGSAGRRTTAFDRELGPWQDPDLKLENITKSRADEASPLYDNALWVGGAVGGKPKMRDVSPILHFIDRELKTAVDVEKTALNRVRNMLVGPNGRLKQDMPSLHKVYLGLGRMLSGSASDSLDKVTRREITQIKNKMKQLMGEDYKSALKVFKSQSDVMDAFDEGLNAFNKGVRPTQIARTLRNAAEAEKDAYREGARVALQEGIDKNIDSSIRQISDLNRTQWGRDKIRAIWGDDVGDRISKTLDDEFSIIDTGQRIIQNSETASRQEVQKSLRRMGGEAAAGALPGLFVGGFSGEEGFDPQRAIYGGLLGSAGGRLAGRALTKRGARKELQADKALAKTLSMGGPEADRILSLAQALKPGQLPSADRLATRASIAMSPIAVSLAQQLGRDYNK
jgi:hypothetical protein